MQRLSIALVLLVVVGCEEDAKTGAGAGGRAAVIEAWKKGGLEVSAMSPASVAFGKDCQSGTLAGVDILVCEYPTPAEAEAAKEAALGWVGDTTGMSQVSGKVVIAAADRRKADPSGRTINKMMKLAK